MKKREQNVAKGKKKTAKKVPAKKAPVKKASQSASKKASQPAKKAAVKTTSKKTVSTKTTAKPAAKTSAKAPAKTAKASSKSAVSAKTSSKSASPKTLASFAKAATQQALSVVKSIAQKKTSAQDLDLSDFITPLDDRVLVLPKEKNEMTDGGLYIPDTALDVNAYVEGQVVSVGRGHRSPKGFLRPMDVQVGDKVMFAVHAGSFIKIQEYDLLILREADVLGVVV